MTYPKTKAALNRRFKAEGLPVELVKGLGGYFYFVFDDGNPNHHDTESVYVYAFDHDCPKNWYDTGVAFAARRTVEVAHYDRLAQIDAALAAERAEREAAFQAALDEAARDFQAALAALSEAR